MSMPSLEPEETPSLPERRQHLRRRVAAEPAFTAHPEPATERRPTSRRSRRDRPRTALEPAGDGWALIALVPYDGHEPPAVGE